MSVLNKLSSALVGVLALVAAAAMFAGPAGAAPYGGGATISVSSSVVAPGGTITVSGSGFEANQTVRITLYPEAVVLGTTTSESSGAWSATVTIPSDTALGRHTITAMDTAGDSASVTITVTAAAGPSGGGGGGVSTTGVAVMSIGALGVLLVAGGAVMLMAGRRRKVAA